MLNIYLKNYIGTCILFKWHIIMHDQHILKWHKYEICPFTFQTNMLKSSARKLLPLVIYYSFSMFTSSESIKTRTTSPKARTKWFSYSIRSPLCHPPIPRIPRWYAFCMVFHVRWIFLTTSLRIPPESRSDEGGIRRRVVRNEMMVF